VNVQCFWICSYTFPHNHYTLHFSLYLVLQQIFQLLPFLFYKFKKAAYNQTTNLPLVGYCTSFAAVALYFLTKGLKYSYQHATLKVIGCAGLHTIRHSNTLNIHTVYYFPTKEQQPRQPKMRGSTVGNTAGTSRINCANTEDGFKLYWNNFSALSIMLFTYQSHLTCAVNNSAI
jgi:hypothetical protein